MKMLINDNRKVFAIQDEFNDLFPFLKIKFFSKPAGPGGAPVQKFVNNSKTLGECRTIHNSGEITITPQMTISELEERFSDVYGLGVEVFRKLGTEDINAGATLEEQNKRGAA
ncbi:MAG: hypothetical protein ACXVPQ_01855 [Bacteroidia bacterium]